VELLAIIAEHLIGDFAFGTAASLNLASKSVRSETLPVLYETVMLAHYDVPGYLSRVGGPPEGLKYTR
jgi:hypothetical protein